MAYDDTPTALFSGWGEDGVDITLPIASVPGLTAEEADASAGSAKEILRALVERGYQWYAALAAEDRPQALTLSKSVALQSSGTFSGKYRVVYTVTVYVDAVEDAAAEPPA